MRSGIHRKDAQEILGESLTAIFEARGLSARGVERSLKAKKHLKISNKTVSNLLNGAGNPILSNILAVAEEVKVPLWQLVCPGIEPSRHDEQAIRALLDDFMSLSPLSRERLALTIRDAAEAESHRRAQNSIAAKSESSPKT